MQRIREATRALEARAKEQAAAAAQLSESAKSDSMAQYNFTDPESRIMRGPGGFVQAYKVQVAVDALHLIVGHSTLAGVKRVFCKYLLSNLNGGEGGIRPCQTP